MRWWGHVSVAAEVLLIACSTGSEPTPRGTSSPPNRPDAAAPAKVRVRSSSELVQVTSSYLATIQSKADDALPRPGDRAFLEPPQETELAWINDRAIPLEKRLELAMKLNDESKAVMKRYGVRDMALVASDPDHASDSTESLRWAESVIREFGRISSALTEEFLPTLSPGEPDYAARMEGFAKMRQGAAGMLQGSLITLNARRSSLTDRRRLAAAWREHAPRYAKLWGSAQCTQLVQWVSQVLASETDAAIREDLNALSLQLATCVDVPASP